jgi:hypothetical protein
MHTPRHYNAQGVPIYLASMNEWAFCMSSVCAVAYAASFSTAGDIVLTCRLNVFCKHGIVFLSNTRLIQHEVGQVETGESRTDLELQRASDARDASQTRFMYSCNTNDPENHSTECRLSWRGACFSARLPSSSLQL